MQILTRDSSATRGHSMAFGALRARSATSVRTECIRVTCMAGRKASGSSSSSRRSGGGSNQPAWKRYAKKDKTLGKRAEATLEMIWSKTAWLTDDHIQGMWEEHRVRKDVVVAWFAEKRKESRRVKKEEMRCDDQEEMEGDATLDVNLNDDVL